MVKRSVDAAPRTGAAASARSHLKACLQLPSFFNTRFTVLMPSEKSWVSTATVTTMPTAAEAWKPMPIAMPSKKLCAASASAPNAPRL